MVIPEEIIAEVDELVGSRQRSKFVTEAVREKLGRERLARELDRVAGSVANVDIPGWESPEAATEWVRSLRRASDRRIPGHESA
jgi:hypothetical protein